MADIKSDYKIIKKENLPKSEVGLEVVVPYDEIKKHWNDAVKNVSAELELPGFRKGKVPEKMTVETLGEHVILEEAAEKALNLIYPEILMNEKIEAIGRPSISIVKIAKDNPLVVKIRTAILPKVDLPNYKKIA